MKQLVRSLQLLILLIMWGIAQAQEPFCIPIYYPKGCTDGDGLTQFQMGTINQSIPCNGTPSYYHDYTALSTTIQAGVETSVTFMAGYANTYVSIWIDLNNNNEFELSERLLNGFNCEVSNTSYTTTITIAEGSPSGNHRLRYKTYINDTPLEPCGTYPYGNSCDFTVILQSVIGLSGSVINCCNSSPVAGATVSCGGKTATTGIAGNFMADNNETIILDAFPNPFSVNTTITFTCEEEGIVKVKLFNYIGKVTALLFEQKAEKEIQYTVEVDGSKLSQGLYFCVLQHADGTMKIMKLVFTK
jgi:hypothetical protein